MIYQIKHENGNSELYSRSMEGVKFLQKWSWWELEKTEGGFVGILSKRPKGVIAHRDVLTDWQGKVSEIDEGTDEHSNLWDRICGNI